MIQYCRLQIGCLLLVIYISWIYIRQCKKYRKKIASSTFSELVLLGIISIILDGVTAVTVNYLDVVNPIVNKLLHMFFLLSLDAVIYMLFGYMLQITGFIPKRKVVRATLHLPYVLSIIVLVANIGSLEFREGNVTNYSMGISAYTCFAMIGVYILFSLLVFFKRWNYIESNKRASILTYILAIGTVGIVQAIYPEILMTSMVTTLVIIGIYMYQEDPTRKEVARYHREMVMGFATLVENKDGSTGGHIKRTTAYVQLLAEALRDNGHYSDILTKDYITTLGQAAPMHDIGKISVPDVVLQKPGRLTDEEFALIKKHTDDGAKIIKKTFFHLGNEVYAKMAYEVAKYHHEKWNGRGYPEGLKEEEIPLCARIMSVADVFDAVSEKRCYRDALPMDECFAIIQKGSGSDFDPVIAQTFLEIRDKVEKIHHEINKTND